MLKATPLFSGSSGNCVYVQYNNEEILIDAGVSFKKICTALSAVGTDIAKINAARIALPFLFLRTPYPSIITNVTIVLV